MTPVRTTSLLCLVGLGFGVGSLLLYRLVRRLSSTRDHRSVTSSRDEDTSQADMPARKRRRVQSDDVRAEAEDDGVDDVSPTGDSGISLKMGNRNSLSPEPPTVLFSRPEEILVQKQGQGLRYLVTPTTPPPDAIYTTATRSEVTKINDDVTQRRSTSSERDEGILVSSITSLEPEGGESDVALGAQHNGYHGDKLQQQPPPEVRLSKANYMNPHQIFSESPLPTAGFSHSTPHTNGNELRQRIVQPPGCLDTPPASDPVNIASSSLLRARPVHSRSCSSDLASISRDVIATSRDMMGRSCSLDRDLSELSLVSMCTTPDSEMIDMSLGEIGMKTAASMENIAEELEDLNKDIDDIDGRLEHLHQSQTAEPELEQALQVFRRGRDPSGRRSSVDSSDLELSSITQQQQQNGNVEKQQLRRSYHFDGEFFWDYQADLCTQGTPPAGPRAGLMGYRPSLIAEELPSSDSSRAQSPSLDHVRRYFQRSLSLTRECFPRSTSEVSMLSTSNPSARDLYIDDDYSELEPTRSERLPKITTSTGVGASGPDPSPEVHLHRKQRSKRRVRAHADLYGRSADSSTSTSGVPTPESRRRPLCDISQGSPHSPRRRQFTKDAASSPIKVLEAHKSDNCGSPRSNSVQNISAAHDVPTYASNEWRGETQRAKNTRQGYNSLPQQAGCSRMRVVRGDNYCALRATAYQLLLNRTPLKAQVRHLQASLKKLQMFESNQCQFLRSWSFAHRLPVQSQNPLPVARSCLDTLYKQITTMASIDELPEREDYISHLLNSQPRVDLHLCEALKALELFSIRSRGEEVPTFAEILFARDTSLTPQAFFQHHMNGVGDTHGLEQVEMFLLGYTLGVQLQVFRPSHVHQPDFCTFYPSECAEETPKLTLIAEDDRHYNVLVP